MTKQLLKEEDLVIYSKLPNKGTDRLLNRKGKKNPNYNFLPYKQKNPTYCGVNSDIENVKLKTDWK